MVNLTDRTRGNIYGVPASIVATPGMHSLCGFFLQSAHEDNKPPKISDYKNPTLAEYQVVHDHACEAYLAVSIILILGRSIYWKLIEDLSQSYLMGTNQYLLTRVIMHNTIVHWWNCTVCYGLRTPPGAIVFMQDNNGNSANGKMHANDGQR